MILVYKINKTDKTNMIIFVLIICLLCIDLGSSLEEKFLCKEHFNWDS